MEGQDEGTQPQWADDPEDPTRLRYWDDKKWTSQTKPKPRERPQGPINRLAVTAFVLSVIGIPAHRSSELSWNRGPRRD